MRCSISTPNLSWDISYINWGKRCTCVESSDYWKACCPCIWSLVPLAMPPNLGPRFRQDSKMGPLPFLFFLALPATVFTQTTAFDALDCCAVKKVDGKMNTHFFYQFLHIIILALHIHRYGWSWRNLLFGWCGSRSWSTAWKMQVRNWSLNCTVKGNNIVCFVLIHPLCPCSVPKRNRPIIKRRGFLR